MQATGARRRAVGDAAHRAATRWEHRRTQPRRPRSRPWTEDDDGAAAERAVPLSVPLSVGAVGAAADAIGDVVRAVVNEHREELNRLNAYIQGGY